MNRLRGIKLIVSLNKIHNESIYCVDHVYHDHDGDCDDVHDAEYFLFYVVLVEATRVTLFFNNVGDKDCCFFNHWRLDKNEKAERISRIYRLGSPILLLD